MSSLHDSNIIGRIRKGTNSVCHEIFALVRCILFAIVVQQYRRGQISTYFELYGICITIMLVYMIQCYIRKHCIDKDWNFMCGLVPETKHEQFENHFFKLNLIIAICYFCGVYVAYFYFDRPGILYGLLSLVVMLGLLKGFEFDRMMWRLTIGRRIDTDTADQIYTMTFFYSNNEYRPYGADVFDIRYFLCNGLRIGMAMELSNVKPLLEAFPGYIHLTDRDGMSPFEIACQFASLDIVQLMVELDDKIIAYVDERGNTPLHWACRRKPCVTPRLSHGSYQGLNVVNYLLEKQMSLVTVANKDGDLPIHLASYRMKNPSPHRVGRANWNWKASEPERIEIVWRLLLAYPECLNCVGGGTSCSNGKYNDKKKNR